MSEREIKNIDLEFKQEAEGKVSAVFSVFNNLDSDGDVVLPGAIKSGFKSSKLISDAIGFPEINGSTIIEYSLIFISNVAWPKKVIFIIIY